MPRLSFAVKVVFGVFLLAGCGRDAFVAPLSLRNSGETGALGRAAASSASEVKITLGETHTLQFSAALLRSRTTDWHSADPSIASVNGSGLVRGNRVGTTTVTATNAGVSQQFSVVVYSAPTSNPGDQSGNKPTMTGLVLSPKSGVALPFGGSRQFSATFAWSDGTSTAAQVQYSATGGSISTGGLYTAGSVAGTFMVVANCLCGFADTAVVQLAANAPQLTKLTISPKNVTLAPSATQQFTVTANWSTGATDVPPVTWSASGGTVSSSGLYVAPSAAGTYSVIVKHNGGMAVDSAVVTIDDTGREAAASPFYENGFESGGMDGSNGFVWQAPTNVTVSSERARNGRYSLRFRFGGSAPGGDAWAEQRFDMGRYVSELWLEYELYIPANFKHRDEAPHNNKFLALWRDGTDNTIDGSWRTTINISRRSDYESELLFGASTSSSTTIGRPPRHPQLTMISRTGPIVIGSWNNIRIHVRPASRRGILDGVAQIWINGQLFYEIDNGDFNNSTNQLPNVRLRGGYLFGWANSGYDETTDMFIDDIKFYDRWPGWPDSR